MLLGLHNTGGRTGKNVSKITKFINGRFLAQSAVVPAEDTHWDGWSSIPKATGCSVLLIFFKEFTFFALLFSRGGIYCGGGGGIAACSSTTLF
jgi:hypothetical protein